MASKFKFPDSKARSPNKPAVFCTAERVLKIYNQEHEKPAVKISKKVREWFFKTAHEKGWSGIHFIPEVQSQHGAGCMLWVEQDQSNIQVTAAVLVLASGSAE
ncbi:hypothetical protein ACQ859_11000 [Roseateles chitinivorans]|uniref:hypothetical protein n=1 Tax=Roseateles chitinivorans TaxID=2917965 RepID=UPI003D672190